MRLRRGLRVLRTGTDQVQIGTDPRWAVRLHGLSPSQCRAVLQGAERSLHPALPEEVIDQLSRLGLTRPDRVRDAVVPARLLPDARTTALVCGSDPRMVRRRRAEAVVAVSGLGRTGVQIACTLAASGIGTLLLDDPRPVTEPDTGTGLTPGEVGQRRHTVVARILRTTAPGVHVGSPGKVSATPTVMITVEADAVDPARTLALASAGIPQLPVVLREADALVGPLAVSGGACPRCVELARADLDPIWPQVLGLLCSADQDRPEPVVLAAVTGALAAAEALALIDGGQPVTRGHQYEIPLPTAEPRLRAWAAHPECGCAALPSDLGT
ncbi:hypothetical protein [Cellulomonas sp. NPDC089187]|uniref:hypothetical protein n=1 Tax=Cellulomonas sp. NPDC089187 TaxID=3154970 RepID=UPI00341ABBB4